MAKLSENDDLKENVVAIKEAIHFLSNDCKPEREIWVVRYFLSQLFVEFSNAEICASSDEPVDVVYGDARFQVKEIIDKDRKRHDEYRGNLQKAENATSLSDLIEEYQLKKVDCDYLVPIVAEKACIYQRKYGPSGCMSTDLLFYFNLQDIHVDGDIFPNITPYLSKMEAWRSVSVYSGDCALVLHVSKSAPSFLKKAKGKVHRNPSIWLDE